ncbi:MAG TPA: GNAT family N-acetyltransferase [Acidimicrobiales bacterium]|nr:GNAT family N-acetyltransferase [Acidimicrobiales bacterium]
MHRRDDTTEVFVVTLDGRPVGMAQRYLLSDEPAWREALAQSGCDDGSAGIDYLLGEEDVTGRGLGPLVIDAPQRPGAPGVARDASDCGRRVGWACEPPRNLGRP